MRELIKKILAKLACSHKWELHNRTERFMFDEDQSPYKRQDTLICQNCGKIKKIIL